MNRREALVIRAFCGWTVFVWLTRIKNILGDDHDFGFKAVHTMLAFVSVAFAVVVWRVVGNVRHKQREHASE
jgi:uncharacterized membrane protein